MNNESIQDTKTRADINSSTLNIANEGFKYMLAVSGGAIALAVANYDKFPFKMAVFIAMFSFIYSLFCVGRCLHSAWFHQLQAIAKSPDIVATSNYMTTFQFRSLYAFVAGCVLMMIALLPIAVTIQIL
jgi:hypothetical protein